MLGFLIIGSQNLGPWRAGWGVNVGDRVISYRKIEGPHFAASSGRLLLVSRRQALEKIGASFEINFLYENALTTHHFNRKLVLVFPA